LVRKKKLGKNQRDRLKRDGMQGNWRDAAGKGLAEGRVGTSVSSSSSRDGVKTRARETLEEKWEVENEVAIAKARLAKVKAEKDLEYQHARDVDAEARKSKARIMKDTESSKVATEKAFAFLKSTGNVPGFCETVVSSGSSPGLTDGSSPECTISPDSSASMHEFREAQKKIADLEFQNKKLMRQLEYGKLAAGEEAAFTIHTDGEVDESVEAEIAKHVTDYHDVDRCDDGFGQDRAYTLFVKKVCIPSAEEYL